MMIALPEYLLRAKMDRSRGQKTLLKNPTSLVKRCIPQVDTPEVIVSDDMMSYRVLLEGWALNKARLYPGDIAVYEATLTVDCICCSNVAMWFRIEFWHKSRFFLPVPCWVLDYAKGIDPQITYS
jgi:hypothetical protein